MLTIYGTPASRTYRTLWMANELGIEYRHEPVEFRRGEHRTEAYLQINPNGLIPAIKDGDFILWESLAINLYLARKHPGPLTPVGLEEESLAWQWSFWAVTEIEHHAMDLLHESLRPEAERAPIVVDRAREAVTDPLAVLDGVLATRRWLVADRFTVADLNVAGVMRTLHRFDIDFTACPNSAEWLARCLERPAAIATNEMQIRALAALEA